jgi:hypothetical protein
MLQYADNMTVQMKQFRPYFMGDENEKYTVVGYNHTGSCVFERMPGSTW